MEHLDFPRWLRDQRYRNCWTQVEMAQRIGASSKTVSVWETGAQTPSDIMGVRLARAFDLDMADVLSRLAKARESS